MKTLELSLAAGTIGLYAQDSNTEPIILTENGKPVAALVSVQGASWQTIEADIEPLLRQIMEKPRTHRNQDAHVSPDEGRRHIEVERKHLPLIR